MLVEYFNDVWIQGEVSDLKVYPSGHCYFALKDSESQIDAVCFRSVARFLKFQLEDGLQIIGHGHLELYIPRGKYQMVFDTIEPKGLGALQLAFEKLKRRLEAEGLFKKERKKPLPVLPQGLGIVTSPAGAAIHDVLRTLHRHGAKMPVLLYPSQVQGEGAGNQIAKGIRYLNKHWDIDVIIIARGGGSIEDLWPFNEEIVARAIADSDVPVVSGVGHEVDFTIADFAADVRAATPTAAAEIVAKGWKELAGRFDETSRKLIEGIEQALLDRERRLEELIGHRAFELAHSRMLEARYRVERFISSAGMSLNARLNQFGSGLNRLNERLARRHPIENLLRQGTVLESLVNRMAREVEMSLEQHHNRLGQVRAKLDTLNPLASLDRGYAICCKEDGTIVNRVDQVEQEERVDVMVSDGTIGCEVLKSEKKPQDSGG